MRSDDTPLTPDRDEARDWVLGELSRREYQESKPSWFDKLASGLWDWLTSLEITATDGQQGIGLLVLILVIAAVIVTAFIIFGRPALARRSRVATAIFGEDDARTAAHMRADAQAHASQGRWTEAIADLFRAIARGLADRAVVHMAPGTTAQDFAVKAGRAFPTSAADLAHAAEIFDSVRYLDHEGTQQHYESLVRLDRALQGQKPIFAKSPLATAGQQAGGVE